MFKKLSHVMLYVSQVDRAQKFYVETLGFSVGFSSPHYAMLHHRDSGVRLDLHPTGEPIGKGGSPYFLVEDIDGVVASLRKKGLEVHGPRSEGGAARFATFCDPDGNELGLTEAAKR